MPMADDKSWHENGGRDFGDFLISCRIWDLRRKTKKKADWNDDSAFRNSRQVA